MISGTQCTSLSQNGRNPRPAGLPLCKSTVQLLGDGPEHDIKQRLSARHRNYTLRPKGIYQVHLGPQSVTNHSMKTRTDLRTSVQHVTNMIEQRTAEESPGRPLTVTVKAMQLLPTSRLNQEHPREGGAKSTAILGRPHLSSSGALPSRGSQAESGLRIQVKLRPDTDLRVL